MMNQSSLTDALELLVAPFAEEPEEWNDVLRRAERDVASMARPSKRLVLLAAALLVAVGLVASAYAVGRHFLVGDAAPPEVTREAALLPIVKGELIPRAAADFCGLLRTRPSPTTFAFAGKSRNLRVRRA